MSYYNSETVMVHSSDCEAISFKVELEWYYDPGRTWGDPELCYPPEGEKLNEEILEVYVCGKEITDGELVEHILNSFEYDWIIEEAWEQV